MTTTVKRRLRQWSIELIGPFSDFRLWVMGRLKYLDTQKGLMFLCWGGDESLSRSSSGMTTRAERSCRQVRGNSGKAHHHFKPLSHTCYPIVLLLTHGAGSHPKARKLTVLHPVIQGLFWWQMFGYEITRRSKEIFTKGSCLCVTDACVCQETTEISKAFKWCINVGNEVRVQRRQANCFVIYWTNQGGVVVVFMRFMKHWVILSRFTCVRGKEECHELKPVKHNVQQPG